MTWKHPDRVAERPGTAEFGLANVPCGRTARRLPLELEVGECWSADLIVVPGRAVDHLHDHVVGRQSAQRHAGPHHEARSWALLAIVGLDVLDGHAGPRLGDPVFPRRQLPGAGKPRAALGQRLRGTRGWQVQLSGVLAD